ncbi:MAG: 4Fe-4S dicluster domain-containing protein [Ruminococcaceae bacterium]|nr:4Fe-4S dicluster domain-containing protein [Oscillospiraceae bacterium]
MKEILRLKPSNCKNCYKCIRHCPVKAIRFSAGQAHVVGDECILCGQCFAACPQNAKQISSELEAAKVMLMSGPVYASIAPSFAAAYPGIGISALEEAMKQLGFAGVEETAIGATIVKNEYARILREEKPDVLISSCCTTINLLMRKHYPDTLFALAPVLSPLQAHCKEIKRRHPEAKTVFVGPCIAKKYEAEESDLIDAVLSFDELSAWLEEKNISLTPRQDEAGGGKTRLFPTTGGVLNSMEKSPEYTYLALDGIEKCTEVLEEIRAGSLHRCFIELSACPGSCANGPLLGKHLSTPGQNTMRVLRYAADGEFSVEQPEKEDCARTFSALRHTARPPLEVQITDVLTRLGKHSPEDELNCGSCGYNTCREKAVAVIQGKAELSMCLPYMMKRAEGFSDTVVDNSPEGILVLNEDLEVQRINPEACRLLRVRNEKDVLGDNINRLMEPDAFRKVRGKRKPLENERIYLAEYECFVDRTILYNTDCHLYICILRDVTEEMTQEEKKTEMRLQAAAIADDVAKKQLKIVQDIASLLGETAADTLIAINRLKETISND